MFVYYAFCIIFIFYFLLYRMRNVLELVNMDFTLSCKLTYKNVSKHYVIYVNTASKSRVNNEQFTKFCLSTRDSLSSRAIFPIYLAVMRLCIFSISISQLASCRTGKISVRRTRNITHALVPSIIIIGHDRG